MDAKWPVSFPKPIVTGTRIYYGASFLAALAVSFPHAVLTPILLAKGLNLSQIALVQVFCSLAVFLFEIPSGIAADSLGRKRIYVISKLLLAVFGVLVFCVSSPALLCLAWFIYGVSNAFESGTIGNEAILAVRNFCRGSGMEPGKTLHYLVRLDARCETIGLIVGGLVGSAVYPFVGDALYLWVAVAALFVALFVQAAFRLHAEDFEQEKTETLAARTNMAGMFRATISEAIACLKDASIRRIILVIAVTQIFFQVHFQFWQAYFLAEGVSSRYFGIVYVAFQLISVLVTFLGASAVGRLRSSRTLKVVFGVVAAASLMVMFTGAEASLAAYLLFVFGFWIVVFYSDAHFRSMASEESLSTLTSVSSAVSRICSMLTLGVIGVVLRFLPVTRVIPLFFLVACLMLVGLYAFTGKRNRAAR